MLYLLLPIIVKSFHHGSFINDKSKCPGNEHLVIGMGVLQRFCVCRLGCRSKNNFIAVWSCNGCWSPTCTHIKIKQWVEAMMPGTSLIAIAKLDQVEEPLVHLIQALGSWEIQKKCENSSWRLKMSKLLRSHVLSKGVWLSFVFL